MKLISHAGNVACGKDNTKDNNTGSKLIKSAGKVVCGGDTIAGNVVLDLATPGHGAVAQMA